MVKDDEFNYNSSNNKLSKKLFKVQLILQPSVKIIMRFSVITSFSPIL